MERVRRGIGQDASCPVCGHVVEDTLHVLRDCLAVNEVWEQVVPRSPATGFFNSNLFDWLVSNLQSHKFMVSTEVRWASLFGLIGWHIWKNRNLYVFQGISWKAEEVVKVSMSWAKQVWATQKEVGS